MDGQYPTRKHLRLKHYDYSQPGYYFVTVCTAIRNQNILCSIQNVGAAALGGPQVTLTAEGEIVDQYIQNIDRAYAGQVTVDHYVIMPDHIHFIIQIHSPENGSPRAATPTALPQIVNTLKSLSSKKIGRPIWQRGYYDHVIRSDSDLHETRAYIQNNPLKECDSHG